jgi:fibronectin type 3 domain-containing protein
MGRSGSVRIAVLIAWATTACATWPPLFQAPPPAPAPGPVLVYDRPNELPAPEAVRATSDQYREIPLRWDPVLIPGVAGYVVESAPDEAGPFTERAILADRGVLEFVDHGTPEAPLGDGVQRFYRLRAFAHDGSVSGLVSLMAGATTAPPPAPPIGLRAFSHQPRSVPISWIPSSDPNVAGYIVERSPNSGGPFEVIAQLDGRHLTHLLDAGLGNLSVLYYRVSSRNPGGGRGPASEVVRAVTKATPLPPISLRIASRRLGAIELAWEPNVEPDLLGYRLLRWRKGEGARTIKYVGTAETHTEDIRVGADRVYDYTLVAVDRDGLESRPSSPIRVAGLGYELRASASPKEVRLAWNPRPDEGFVRARITRTSTLWQERTFEAEGGELRDRDVSPGRAYHYRIQLVRADGRVAPASRPLSVEVPRDGFVEIQAPASRLPQPDGNPR